MSSLYTNVLPPRPQWSVEQIPDLSGKVMIVTGGNTGIGKETVKQLLLHNAKVYLAARSPDKARAAIEELKQETGKEAIFLQLDLADLKSIKVSAEEFLKTESRLDVLFNSAGVMATPPEMLTADGYDLQFGTNVLGHYYFTELLLPLLISSAASSPDGKARIIHTSSMGHMGTKTIDYETLRDSPKRNQAGRSLFQLYFQSKFGNVVYALELHRRYADKGIVSVSLHPGNLKTELARYMSPMSLVSILFIPFLYPVPMGALTQLWAGTTPEGAEFGGKYLIPWARIGEPLKETQDIETGRTLSAWLAEQVKSI